MSDDEQKHLEDIVEEVSEESGQTPLERFFYHQRRALEETGKALEALFPPGFREHGSAATKEFSAGFRILIDAAIDELKRVSERDADAPAQERKDDDDDNKPSTTGKGKIKVKVD